MLIFRIFPFYWHAECNITIIIFVLLCHYKYYNILFLAGNQEGKAISGAVRRLRDYENATEEAETHKKEKEKGS